MEIDALVQLQGASPQLELAARVEVPLMPQWTPLHWIAPPPLGKAPPQTQTARRQAHPPPPLETAPLTALLPPPPKKRQRSAFGAPKAAARGSQGVPRLKGGREACM